MLGQGGGGGGGGGGGATWRGVEVSAGSGWEREIPGEAGSIGDSTRPKTR